MIRHEKLHIREATAGVILISSEEVTVGETIASELGKNVTRARSENWPDSAAATYNSPSLSIMSEDPTIPTLIDSAPSQLECTFEAQSALPQDELQTGLDFELIWPDSVDLFQTLVSQDASLQWQMPLGTLPFTSEAPLQGENVSPSRLTPASSDDRVSSIGTIPGGGNDQALKDVRTMVATSSTIANAAIDGVSINSVFLDECLHMFFVKFIPTFPVLHRATFVFRDCTHPLLLNAIAIGSLYLGPKTSLAKGEALWRLSHTAVATSWQTLIAHYGPYDAGEGVQLVITALLGQIYGSLSKNRSIRSTSQATRALSFSWARRCGMLDSYTLANSKSLPSNATEAEKDRQWRLWVGEEIQHRALLAHYVVDGLIAQMTGEPTSVRHAANQLGLPNDSTNDAAFEANTADEWIHALQLESQKSPRTSVRSVLHSLFSPGPTTAIFNFSAFSLRVVLEGIQSILSECDGDSDGIVGVLSRSEVRSALSHIHVSIIQSTHMSPADRLETLSRWHATCIDAILDPSSLCKGICSQWKVEQYVWPTNKAQVLKYNEACCAKSEDARRALLHAVAIQDIIETLPRGRAHAIHMPSSLFAAATIYAVFALTGLAVVELVNDADWRLVMNETGADEFFMCDTQRYIRGDRSGFGPVRNMVYELNSIHKLMGYLKTQWGIAHDMENVIEQWVSLCH